MSIPIPEDIRKQLPFTKYRLLESLVREHDGLPLPPPAEAVAEALELVESVLASPVFEEGTKIEARKWKETLLEHAGDWERIKADSSIPAPLYRVLVGMQEEIGHLRHALNLAQQRLDANDEARLNHARRLVGLPPARTVRSGVATPPHMHAKYATPCVIQRLSADRLRDALEAYLDESPPFDASRGQMVRALKVCCGMEEDTQ